ncbi:MAG TPA: AMP-binding protein [Casimicrobiaceae bacterium]
MSADVAGCLQRWVVERPHAMAIVDGEQRVSYRELGDQAARVARRIATAAGGRRGSVGLLFADKCAGIKAMAGAMWGGHVCVALDAGDPPERLRFILGDAEPVALVTDAAHLERARAVAPRGCAVVDVDSTAADVALPRAKVDPHAIAYIAYTSGSTGTPKGVMQSHANLMFFVETYVRMFGIGPGDRQATLSAFGVPAGIGDILRSLMLGVTLCVYDVRRRGIAGLADWLDLQRVTIFHAVPTVWREMTRRLPAQRVLPHLRLVHLGGEAVFGGDVERFRAHTPPQCVLFNQLAGTESGVVARNVITHATPVPLEGIVPAGRPIDGVELQILREDGTLAASGEVGEIVVGSAHLSPGYWRRPDLDATAFSSDAMRPGWRLYRTGDLGSIDTAGVLRFHGRRGTRVKVHGHSVDLTEIEAALSACPGVACAAVVARGDSPDGDSVRIAAYVEAESKTHDHRSVRGHLASRLPRYMLPAEILYVDAMPRGVGRKIDRLRLADTQTLREPERDIRQPPRDDVERSVAGEFQRLLGVDAVGIDDDFFLLGGDSLMTEDLQNGLLHAHGVHIGSLHEDATVAGIAARIRRAQASGENHERKMPVMLPLWRNGAAIPLFIVHGRNGQAFVSPHFMRLLGDDQPVWAFQARGLDGKSEPHTSIEAMADEYLAEMRKVRPHGPYFLGSLCAGVFIVTIIARKLREAGETVLPLLLLDPPNSVFQPGYLSLTREQFEHKMRTRKANGGSGGPVDDPAYMQALMRTVLAFERAIASHRPHPYDGDVFLLSSTARAQAADVAFIRRMFTGNAVRHEIGATHRSALSPQNPAFVRALADTMTRIREAARAAS